MKPEFDLNRKTFELPPAGPGLGTPEEHDLFEKIQLNMASQYENIFPDDLAPRTVVINPSLTLDAEILSKIRGSIHYEERLLCLLMLLRLPRTKVIYLSSMPLSDVIIDYYLHLLQGITGLHARNRLTMLSCYDLSKKSLTEKILDRPRLIERIKSHITDPLSTHLTCYNITPLEKSLAVKLGIPIFGTDPSKFYEGSKSGARKTFRACGIDMPDGDEDLKTREDIAASLARLKRKDPALRKAVVKMNDGFSGDGNAIYRYPEMKIDESLESVILKNLDDNIRPVSKDVSKELFFEKFFEMEGIVEEFLEGEIKVSPSVQCVVGTNKIEIASTHDQLLGGEDGQIFLGAIFPADIEYASALAEMGQKVSDHLSSKGVLGRFAVDFISVKQEDNSWKHFAIEINLRKGGTTHPFMMIQFLTNGFYNAEKGVYVTASGNERYYFASDNVQNDMYIGITPLDLIDIAMFHKIMYDGASQEGVVFHLIGALSEFGKLGLVCIGSTPERAKEFYDNTIRVLDFECSN
ncbi:MAG TPA: peptide ligase PGM1-related protein [Ignavibacteria bacterium]|nr:peptide ligase PGM1-related protein [Ignavibacteria bacterium]